MLDFSSIYSLGELECLLLHGKERNFSWKSEEVLSLIISGLTNIIVFVLFLVCHQRCNTDAARFHVLCCSCITWLCFKGHLSTITSGVNCFQGIITGVVMIWHVGNSGGHFSITRNDCGTPTANWATTFVSSATVQPSLGSLIYMHFAYFRFPLWQRRIKHCFDWSPRKLPFCSVTCRQNLIPKSNWVISWCLPGSDFKLTLGFEHLATCHPFFLRFELRIPAHSKNIRLALNFRVKEKFAPVIQHFEEIVKNSRRLGGCRQHWLFCSISWSNCRIKNHWIIRKLMISKFLHILVDASCLLGLPILATEQYPRYFDSILLPQKSVTNKSVGGFDIYQFILSQGSGCNGWSS